MPSVEEIAANQGAPAQPSVDQATLLQQKKLKDAAQGLEGVFLGMVFKEMQKSIPQDGLFNSDTTEMFSEMLQDELGNVLAKKQGGVGLAKYVIDSVNKQMGLPSTQQKQH